MSRAKEVDTEIGLHTGRENHPTNVEHVIIIWAKPQLKLSAVDCFHDYSIKSIFLSLSLLCGSRSSFLSCRKKKQNGGFITKVTTVEKLPIKNRENKTLSNNSPYN